MEDIEYDNGGTDSSNYDAFVAGGGDVSGDAEDGQEIEASAPAVAPAAPATDEFAPESEATADANAKDEDEVTIGSEKISKKKIHEHISALQREKYRALKEAEVLRAENERLNALTSATAQSALDHYEEAAKQRLEAAKDLKQRAYDSGDIREQVDADVALTKAVHDLQSLHQKQAEHQAAYNYQVSQQAIQQPNHDLDAREWVERNQWFTPSSESYDEWMAGEMNTYLNQLDNNLYRNGMQNKIMSPEYFQAVDEHSRQLMEHRMRANNNDLNMRKAPTGISPAGGARANLYTPNTRNMKGQQRLSADELAFAKGLKGLGVTPEMYLQHKTSLNKTIGKRNSIEGY